MHVHILDMSHHNFEPIVNIINNVPRGCVVLAEHTNPPMCDKRVQAASSVYIHLSPQHVSYLSWSMAGWCRVSMGFETWL